MGRISKSSMLLGLWLTVDSWVGSLCYVSSFFLGLWLTVDSMVGSLCYVSS